ncbi:MAG: NAD(P)-dependent oxidoreductase [Acidimicrobiales bacterium]
MSVVVVTGASGFIGRTTIVPLLDLGHQVHAVARRAPPSGVADRAIWHEVDLLDPRATRRLLEEVRADGLVHLAWYARPGDWFTSTENVRWVEASIRLLRVFAELGGRRAVVSGSCAEYDTSRGVCSEASTPLHPDTLYGVCKRAVEMTMTAAAPDLGLSLAWGRVFSVYGPAEHPKRLAASVITSLLQGDPAHCTSGGQVRDYLYSADVGDALVHLLGHPYEGVVNIASGAPISVADLVTRIAALLGKPELVELGALRGKPEEAPVVVGDVQRLSTEAGWAPAHTLDEGLLETIEWWRTNGVRA